MDGSLAASLHESCIIDGIHSTLGDLVIVTSFYRRPKLTDNVNFSKSMLASVPRVILVVTVSQRVIFLGKNEQRCGNGGATV